MKKQFLKRIHNIQTENDLKDITIEMSQATSNYKLSWDDFMELRAMIRSIAKKNNWWGQNI